MPNTLTKDPLELLRPEPTRCLKSETHGSGCILPAGHDSHCFVGPMTDVDLFTLALVEVRP